MPLIAKFREILQPGWGLVDPARVLLLALCLSGCSSEPNLIQGPSSSSTKATVSFKDDVIPVLRQNCSSTGCHGAKEFNKGIYIPCCKDTDNATIYEELKKDSRLGAGKFVVPGDAKASFLMLKMDNTQGTLDAKCTDPDSVLPPKNCGESMPQGDGLLPQADRDLVRKWIDQGAKNN
jgi:hypothetical protein